MNTQIKLDEIADYICCVRPKILVVEGPDSAGKSTLLKELKETLTFDCNREFNVKVLRFPDNRGNVSIRSNIMDSDMNTFTLGSAFLFMADFVHAFEQYVKPFLDDENTIFLFDRFVPSVCVYQNIPIGWINTVFNLPQFNEFFETMMHVHYLYLTPINLVEHKVRMAKRKGEEINYLDPVGDEAVGAQLKKYADFMSYHAEHKLIGSNKVLAVPV